MPLFLYRCKKCKKEFEKIFDNPISKTDCLCGGESYMVFSGKTKIYKKKYEIPSHKVEVVESPN